MGGGEDGALDSRRSSFSISCLSVLTPRGEDDALDSRRQLSSLNLLPPSVHSSQRSVVMCPCEGMAFRKISRGRIRDGRNFL